jgi:hypothetical protein
MKLRTLFEAKYDAPLEPSQERLPDHLRTKHGIKQHMDGWKESLREVIWSRWWQNASGATEEDLESFVMELESDPEVQRMFTKVPHVDMYTAYQNLYDQVVANFQEDAMEDIEYNQEEDLEDW